MRVRGDVFGIESGDVVLPEFTDRMCISFPWSTLLSVCCRDSSGMAKKTLTEIEGGFGKNG